MSIKTVSILQIRIACDNMLILRGTQLRDTKNRRLKMFFHRQQDAIASGFFLFHCWFVNVYLSSIAPAEQVGK